MSSKQGGAVRPDDRSPGPSAAAGASLQLWARNIRSGGAPSGPSLVATSLREGIVSGAVPTGSQLKQDELSEYFGVSPGPVREALRQLESEGLVRHFPNRGAFVTDVSADEAVAVLLPVRFALEKYAFLLVQERPDEELLAQLRQAIQTMQRGADAADVAMINEADVRFHELVVEASSAYQTIQLWRSVLPRIRLQFYRLTPRHHDLAEVPQEHAELLDALTGDDPDHLSNVLEHHIIGTMKSLLQRRDPTSADHAPSSAPSGI